MNKYSILSPFIALLVTGLGAAFSYWVLGPQVGIDDANITQVYARNIAAGHGYVYNIGGERVEGSTSLLWTLINAAAFRISAAPEALLAVLCLALTWLAIFCALQIARGLMPDAGPAVPAFTGAAFLVFPGFFGWMVWSLMDITLWVTLIALTVLVLHRLDTELERPRSGQWLLLAALAAALPVTRPEGIVLTTALAGFYILRGILSGGPGLRIGLVVGLFGIAMTGLATAWRLSYFGYPFPNTFYAKTSTDIPAQLEQGARYLLSYFQDPPNVLFFAFFCTAGALVLTRGTAAQRAYLWLALYLVAGGTLIYAALGGDHFGSHRFFIYFLPLGLPLIVPALVGIVRGGAVARPDFGALPALFLGFAFAVIGVAETARFIQTNGNLRIEFAIADAGRELGRKLNALPGAPVVGVIAAGGIRMTYAGEVQDLLGLNWTTVAHAPDDARIAKVPNHTGFNSDVFWQIPPDVFPIFPSTGICPESWQPLEGFKDKVTDQITRSDAFRDHYELICHEGDAFYASREYLARAWDGRPDLPYRRVGAGE